MSDRHYPLRRRVVVVRYVDVDGDAGEFDEDTGVVSICPRIPKDGGPEPWLDTLLHELLHAAFPDLSEAAVRSTATDMARIIISETRQVACASSRFYALRSRVVVVDSPAADPVANVISVSVHPPCSADSNMECWLGSLVYGLLSTAISDLDTSAVRCAATDMARIVIAEAERVFPGDE